MLPVLLPLVLAIAASITGHRQVYSRAIAPGVALIQEVTPDPLVITTIQVDPKVRGVRLEAALGGGVVWGNDPTAGREAPSRTVAKRHAVAGVNASFFPFQGNPIGLHVGNGELVTEPGLPRTAFVLLNDASVRFARFGWEGSVQIGDQERPLHGLNRKPGKGNELLLFTPAFDKQTLKTPDRVEVVLDTAGNKVVAGKPLTAKVVSIGTGPMPLKPGTVVLSGGGAPGEWLRTSAAPGASVTIRPIVTLLAPAVNLDPAQIRQAVTGAPRIVAGGKPVLSLADEKVAASFSTTRHPRTAIGVKADGTVLLVTVDGRQPGLSRGVTLSELAALLLAQGVVDAVNLDGGGSSACAIRGAVANSPSEGSERPVADCLLVFAEEAPPESDAPRLQLTGPSRALPIGGVYAFRLPEGIDPSTVVWTTRGGIGFIRQDGVFFAQRPGKGSVQLWRGSDSISVPLMVAKGQTTLDDAAFVPKLTLTGETLSIVIANSEGDRLGGEAVTIAVSGGTASPAQVTTNARGEAQVTLHWGPGENQQITVSSPAKRFRSVTLKP